MTTDQESEAGRFVVLACIVLLMLGLSAARRHPFGCTGGDHSGPCEKGEGLLLQVLDGGRDQGVFRCESEASISELLAAAGVTELDREDHPSLERTVQNGCLARILRPPDGDVRIIFEPMEFRERLVLGLRNDPNRATAHELSLLPGIGPVLAERIVESRERNGPYASVHDLDRVKGIGKGKIKKLIPYLEVAGQPCRDDDEPIHN